MWKAKLGFSRFNPAIFNELIELMMQTKVDYTIFFRELSNIPDTIAELKKSFYGDAALNETLLSKWAEWLKRWQEHIHQTNDVSINATTEISKERLSKKMKRTNPKYTLREWHLVPAYKAAQAGDYSLVKELQEVMTRPYEEHSLEIEEKYYRKKPEELFYIAGVSHISCSS